MIATGPGEIRLDHRSSAADNVVWVHLDNFDIDGVDLKAEHRNALDRWFRHNMVESGGLIIPVDRIWVFLRGYASRTGGVEHNIDLSRQRVSNVRTHLTAYVSNSHITGMEHVGASWSHGEIEEDSQYRSVEVIMRTVNHPPEPTTPAFIYDRFRMRAKPAGPDIIGAIAGELDLPGGLGSTVLMIQIENRSTHERRDFLFVSMQVTAGLSAPISSSTEPTDQRLISESSDYGDWVNFRTRSHHHVAFSEFVGSAAFGGMVSVQIGTYSPGSSLGMGENYFQFTSDRLHNVENYVAILPRTIVLPLPPSFGLGFSLISMSAMGRLMFWP